MPFRLEFKSKHGVEFAGFLDRSTDALKDNQSRIRWFYFSHFQRLRFLGGNDFSSWKIFWRRRGLVLGSNFVFLAERWRRQCLNAGRLQLSNRERHPCGLSSWRITWRIGELILDRSYIFPSQRRHRRHARYRLRFL